MLRRHGYALGPDPASTDIATVGGVIANNSGGMRCGDRPGTPTRPCASMTLVLASGTVIDTAAPGRGGALRRGRAASSPRGLLELRDELRADAELAERVRRKFQIKNTMGYRLCAFLDADTPLEIFRRLVVGSEGTLAFVAEAVFETRPEPAAHDRLLGALPVAGGGRRAGAGARRRGRPRGGADGRARRSIAAAHMMPGTPEHWKELPPESAALLVEFGGRRPEALDAGEARGRARCSAATSCCARRSSRASTRRSSWPGACARGCSG